jgi:outer membrane lipopolysaccharide assembly protein LptE/RlpB
MNSRLAALPIVLLVGACALSTGGCGYALAGRGSFLPVDIHTIGVPTFTNRTSIFNVETMLTEKVRSEFISRGRYTIQPQAEAADAVLTGEVTAVSLQPSTISDAGLASQYVITMTAQIQFKDQRTNVVLWENPSLVFREDYQAATGQSTLNAADFFGQEGNALDRITGDFARSIVSSILEAF